MLIVILFNENDMPFLKLLYIISLNGYHEHDTETEISNYRVVFVSYTLSQTNRTKLSCKFMQKYIFFCCFSFGLNINSEIVKR